MLITASKIKQIIREALLHEAAFSPENLPEGVTFRLEASKSWGVILLVAFQWDFEIGRIEARMRDEEIHGPCLGAFVVGFARSQIKGLGPLMYDIVMEAATEIGGGLISDRHLVSSSALNLWHHYKTSRKSEVESDQLDSRAAEDNFTRDTKPNDCDSTLAKNLVGSKWADHPISRAYRKPGMVTIRQLNDMGLIKVEGISLKRIAEGYLRRIIREELLNETPFDQFITPSEPPVTPSYKKQPNYKQHPSIAHPLTRSKEQKYEGEKYIDVVKDLMRNTKDNWVIITPNDVRDRARLGTDEFNEWLRIEKERRPGTIFAFAASMPLPGDENTPQWAVVHDLLGHTLDEFWQRHGGRRREKAIPESKIVSQLHRVLPIKYRMSYESGDMMPDVLAGILLGALTHDRAREVVGEEFQNSATDEEIAEAQEHVDHMFRDVKAWLKNARADGFVVLAPF